MAIQALTRMPSNLWSYISVRQTRKRREKPFKISTPTKPIAKQLCTPPSSVPPTKRFKLSPRKPKNEPVTPRRDFDISRRTSLMTPEETAKKVVHGRIKQEIIDLDEEALEQQKQAREMLADGWAQDTINVYQKLERRGYEPLLPKGWLLDFPLLPAFTFAEDDDAAFLKPIYGSHYRAINAVQNFIELGKRVRDLSSSPFSQRKQGLIIQQHIKAYLDWMYTDAQIKADVKAGRLLPMIALHIGQPNKPDLAEQRIHEKLRLLADQHDERLIPGAENSNVMVPPTLYGVVITGAVVGLVAYEPASVEDDIRTLAVFNYAKPLMDVWSSLAIAIIVVHCRGHMLRAKKILSQAEGWEQASSSSQSEDD
ncbi:hypothetical protein EJ06DRAFT_533780 [Trichodelitschia bisporula]|uniref:Uncharacterized protein n=1 Tax=Trichodelitschia bisporula TaxID=703511 RepID=A0A6G1HKI6_9PEZI|nr:hypothetical protein EJ06DRAFT_533780 [Trichodelitschia bisporula]